MLRAFYDIYDNDIGNPDVCQSLANPGNSFDIWNYGIHGVPLKRVSAF